jgi:hypothetical protein
VEYEMLRHACDYWSHGNCKWTKKYLETITGKHSIIIYKKKVIIRKVLDSET